MLLALDSNTGINSVAQFFTVLLIFIGVLALTYLSTKWIATYQKGKMFSNNITVIETYKITANKFLQIVKIGGKFFAIAIAKDSVTFLGELSEDDLTLPEVSGESISPDFSSILEKAKKFKIKK